MDSDGYIAIEQTLIEDDPDVRITPVPEGDDSVRFVTIESDRGLSPAETLNALGKAGLLDSDRQNKETWNNTPWFRVVGITEDSVTLEDHNPNVSNHYY